MFVISQSLMVNISAPVHQFMCEVMIFHSSEIIIAISCIKCKYQILIVHHCATMVITPAWGLRYIFLSKNSSKNIIINSYDIVAILVNKYITLQRVKNKKVWLPWLLFLLHAVTSQYTHETMLSICFIQ